ncbi:hypothetical protein B0H10DRAFT_1967936 [Mycena sp. CBHHK59/15]|nr:hypothetical protein B0H10DRAFT_1967936 [Mycena sp. CBHHK59/15]
MPSLAHCFALLLSTPLSYIRGVWILTTGCFLDILDKGKELWTAISEKAGDTPKDKTTDKYMASYNDLVKTKSMDTTVGPGFFIKALFLYLKPLKTPLLLSFPATITVKLIISKNEASAAYELGYVPGVIVAINSFNVQDPVDPAKWVNWNFNGDASPTDLKFVAQFHIRNDVTIAVLVAAYNMFEATKPDIEAEDMEWKKWPYEEEATRAVTLALLATDNGKGTRFILYDYKGTLAGKRISAIYTRHQESKWAMAVEFS